VLLELNPGSALVPTITTFPIDIGCKTVSIVIEVVNAQLEYNLLLKHTWFYKMTTIISSIFWVLHFPHQGKIVTINQISFCIPKIRSNVGSNVPFLSDS
jgi:hypothetical protein